MGPWPTRGDEKPPSSSAPSKACPELAEGRGSRSVDSRFRGNEAHEGDFQGSEKVAVAVTPQRGVSTEKMPAQQVAKKPPGLSS
jgi:hypothetical protein